MGTTAFVFLLGVLISASFLLFSKNPKESSKDWGIDIKDSKVGGYMDSEGSIRKAGKGDWESQFPSDGKSPTYEGDHNYHIIAASLTSAMPVMRYLPDSALLCRLVAGMGRMAQF